MPELPEVEFCRRALTRWAQGRRATGFTLHDPRCVRASRTARPSEGMPRGADALAATLSAPCGPIRRHGKRLLWAFGDQALLLHLGMTGKWTRRRPDAPKLQIDLPDGPLWFDDPRLLGGIVPCSLADGERLLSEGLGPDALGPLPPLSGQAPIKVRLMDQAFVAGIGNLHAAEALWRARLHPAAPARSAEAHRAGLERAVHDQLRAGIDLLCAEEEITYIEEDASSNPFPVYRRAGRPCPRCGAAIARMIQGGRSTYWCPGCQTEGARTEDARTEDTPTAST